jgi:hypothetical protein
LGFFLFSKKYFFSGAGWGGIIIFLLFSFIIWWLNEDIFLGKYFKQINVIFLDMKNFQHKIEFWKFNKEIKQYFV